MIEISLQHNNNNRMILDDMHIELMCVWVSEWVSIVGGSSCLGVCMVDA